MEVPLYYYHHHVTETAAAVRPYIGGGSLRLAPIIYYYIEPAVVARLGGLAPARPIILHTLVCILICMHRSSYSVTNKGWLHSHEMHLKLL